MHRYCQHYSRHFGPLRRRRLRVLEIGIGGYENPKMGGASLRMWRDYFPRSTIYGIDITDKSWHDERRIKTFQGSQADNDFLESVLATIGTPDIIIDDGSHRSEHVIASFKFLFPRLHNDGIYVIEDTQTSFWPEYGGHERDLNDTSLTTGFFKSLSDGLNVDEFRQGGLGDAPFARTIVGMHFYHNLIFVDKGQNNEGSNMKEIGIK